MAISFSTKCKPCGVEYPSLEIGFFRNNRKVRGFEYSCKACKYKSQDIRGRKLRDKRRYEKSNLEPKARDVARKTWGPANQWACKVLGCLNKAEELHHIDYSLPLEVIPLCRPHHDILHMNE